MRDRPPTTTPADQSVDTNLPAPAWLRGLSGRAFGLVARLRSGRAVHKRGIGWSGVAHLAGDGVSLGGSPTCEVLVRFSRGAGLPARLPDINGLAIRFLDAPRPGRHQDLLLATTGRGPFRRILMPSVDFATDRFSTLASYRVSGAPVVFAAAVHGDRLTLDELGRRDAIDIELGAVHADGRHDHLGSIHLTDRIDDTELRFDPSAVGPDIVPLGLLNALRPHTYTASQRQPAELEE